MTTAPAELRILQPVTTVLGARGSLQAINTTQLPDHAIVQCIENNQQYQLRRGSTDAPSGDDIVAPAQGGPGRWFKYSGSDGGGSLPLTTVRYCDRGTSVPLADQNGSIAAPFSSVQAALDSLAAASAGSVALMLAPGDYRAETGLTFSEVKALQISAVEGTTRAWQSSAGPLIADLTYSGIIGLSLNGIQHGDIDAGFASISLENCNADAADLTCDATIAAFNCFFNNGTMVGAGVRLRSCEVRGLGIDVTGTVAEVTGTEWTVGGSVEFTGAAGDLRLDSLSEFYWGAMGGAATLANGTIVPLYLP